MILPIRLKLCRVIRQIGTLSPTLFNLALEKVMGDTNNDRRMQTSGKHVMLSYNADDIVIMGGKQKVKPLI